MTVDLLQHEEKHQKAQRLHRTDHHNQQEAGKHPDKRSEIGDQRHKADEHADDHGVRHVENAHDKEEHHSENKRVKALSRNKIEKRVGAEACDLTDTVSPHFIEIRIGQLFTLSLKAFFAREDIDGNDGAGKDVERGVDDR